MVGNAIEGEVLLHGMDSRFDNHIENTGHIRFNGWTNKGVCGSFHCSELNERSVFGLRPEFESQGVGRRAQKVDRATEIACADRDYGLRILDHLKADITDALPGFLLQVRRDVPKHLSRSVLSNLD